MGIFSYQTPPPPYQTPPPSRTPSRSRSLSRTLTVTPTRNRNRALSIRSRKDTGGSSSDKPLKHRFNMASLRGMQQPDLSKKLFKLIKSENHVINSYDNAGRERHSIATQLSEWGEETGDEAISDVSDKIGVLLAEIAEQEDAFAGNLEDYRSVLKQIRNTESSVQPSRDQKAKIADEIAKLKTKEPTSPKLATLEQELVRAEAQSLVAEAQLTNITRQKLKEAYDLHFAATIERAEKQILLARQARRIVNLIDDTPIVPGDPALPWTHGDAARDILNEAEEDLRAWQPNLEPIHSNAKSLGNTGIVTDSPTGVTEEPESATSAGGDVHPALRKGSGSNSRSSSRKATEEHSTTATTEKSEAVAS